MEIDATGGKLNSVFRDTSTANPLADDALILVGEDKLLLPRAGIDIGGKAENDDAEMGERGGGGGRLLDLDTGEGERVTESNPRPESEDLMECRDDDSLLGGVWGIMTTLSENVTFAAAGGGAMMLWLLSWRGNSLSCCRISIINKAPTSG